MMDPGSRLGLSVPHGWGITTFGTLCTTHGGELQTGPFGSQLHAADYSDAGVPVVMPQDIANGHIVTTHVARVDLGHIERLANHKLQAGDIVFSRRGDVTRFAIAEDANSGWLCGTGCLRIRPGKAPLDTAYVRWYLEHPAVKKWLIDAAKGATMPNLNTSILSSLPLLLPPLPEQRRIADILDKADAIRRKRKETIALTEELLRSAFWEMFGDPVTNPKGWETRELERATERIVVGHVGPTSHGYAEDGVQFLRTQNVRPLRLELSDVKYITREFHNSLNKSVIHANDVLVSRVGANRGMAAVVSTGLGETNCANIIVISPGKQIDPAYLAFVINSPRGARQLIGESVGSAQGVINTSAIKVWVLPVPPIDHQRRFGRYVSSVHAMAARFEASEYNSTQLFEALVQQVFNGSLAS